MPVGELYSDKDDPKSVLGQPPAPPTDVPPPAAPVKVEQPVAVHERRMADEDSTGKVRDTSMEAVTKPGHDLNFRNVDDEALVAKQAPPPDKPTDAKPPEPPKDAPKPEVAPVPEPKLFAGKFKTVEDMEAAYKEVESAKSRAFQEKAALERQIATNAAAPPLPAPAKTPEQLAAERVENERIINNFVSNPREFVDKEILSRVREEQHVRDVALAAQAVTAEWRTNNPDLAKYETFVAYNATLLAQSDPELAKDPRGLMAKATEQSRAMFGTIRAEGGREALTTETRVISLANTAPAPSTEQPPQKAPLTADAAYEGHMQFLKEQEQRSHRGLRR